MRIEQGNKLLFIGDSITDCGRQRPDGEGIKDALGDGYVSLVHALLQAVYPERGIRVINMGTSGHTVRDLAARWQTDVLDRQPDWLVIKIGINDVWRQFDKPYATEQHVMLEEYSQTLQQLVQQSKPCVKQIVLLSPFYLEPNSGDAMRQRMDAYGLAMKAIAEAEDCLFVDTQAAFAPTLQELYPAALAWDRVHPSRTGHMVLARAFLQAVDFRWA